ncbi:MAG: AlpA family transcriptional regulator [Thiocapsa sp.]|uniref:helix-turn-helix transcriptional regulator n=1 Tax=Thiocapsa sp. TaxID=2024551 RepID=UPI001BCCABC0|nr:AlpA family transcriptional regulator [Thiocapsa sp.]QVL46681.1 MAG: AlpA family transcriptional regulator [Thiocapsa sp.]
MTRQFLRLPQVEGRTGLKKSTIYKLIALGQFPPPIKLSPRASAWPSDEVDDWQQRQLDTRNAVA